MDVKTNLILIKNKETGEFEDKTAEIGNITNINNKTGVTYARTGRTYGFNSSNVLEFKEPRLINLEHSIVRVDGFPISDNSTVLDFGEYIKVIDCCQKAAAYHKTKVTFQKSCLDEEKSKVVFDYFKELAGQVSVLDDGTAVLQNQYKKLNKVSEDSVLSTYLSRTTVKRRDNKEFLIFPFGFNLSQKEAVKTAFDNQISIIEGPPGTGKTQTILNIIANVVAKGKTVGVVSGNNSATANVQEKLQKNGYEFITALLGNSNKKAEFFENKQTEVPLMADWLKGNEEIRLLKEQLSRITSDLTMMLEDKNKMAKLQEELSKIKIEQAYFESNFMGEFITPYKFSIFKNWPNDDILTFFNHFERFILNGRYDKLIVKSFMFFKYGIYKFQYVRQNQNNIVSSLKKLYYQSSINIKEKTIKQIKSKLENKNYEELMKKYTDISIQVFNASLYNLYSGRARNKYTIKSFKYNFHEFIKDYPVILSTTHSIITSISENYLFDYLIIDEASQVDLVTASLALSCCKNVVIVGDVKQLPQIVPGEIEKKSDEIFYKNNINEVYNYSKYSIIVSLTKLYKQELATTLLCEHYRCHPKIIGFCNEKFYDNQLVILTEDKPNDIPLLLYKTAPGNHARKDNIGYEKGWYNIRQIEVVRDEIIGARKAIYLDCKDVGIISPYRNHVIETLKYIKESKLEVDTVHKFQGREKNTIIFTTVANDINPFVDDANLINVAVSRAVKEFIIVTSSNLFKQHGTNIGDLIRYIEYNSLENVIVESKKVSVFDLLYSDYSEKLLAVMNTTKNISEYKSENLMYSVIEEVIGYPEFSSFKCVIHIPLNSIVKDFSGLNVEERAYAENSWTHVDFLLFNKLDKEPVLVIEVDGHEFHKNNAKQLQRDSLKNKILGGINLPVLRVATNESGEKEKLIEMLTRIINLSAQI